MQVVIDRIEEDMAVVETDDGSLYDIPKNLIPSDAKEGDVLLIEVDKDSTIDREQEIVDLMDDVWDEEEI